MVPLDVVARFPGFALLPVLELTRIASRATRRRCHNGDVLFREGDDAAWLTMVLEGRVKLMKHGPSDRGLVVDLAGPWSVIDAAAALDGGRHLVGAAAIGDAVVVQVPVRDAVAALSAEPAALRAIVTSLCHEIQGLTERAAELGEAGVERRLARVVCRLCARECGPEPLPAGPPVDVPIPLTRHEMAEMVGTSTETAIRVLSKWNAAGIVRTKRDGLDVLSCERLRTIVKSPPRSLRDV